MSTVKNLWGELPLSEVVRTPAIILREQANQLTELTKGILEGQVFSRKIADKKNPFFLQLQIVAPALDGYKFAVMDVQHNVMLYPISVMNAVDLDTYECDDEEEFIEVVGGILSSQSVHKAIAALLSQSNSEQVA